MSLVLAIQSYPKANDTVARHWEFYERSGAAEIIGIGTSDGGCLWPKPIRTELIGANLYIVGDHLCSRLLRTFEHLLILPHDYLGVAEYDCIFLKPVPPDLPPGLTAHLAGGTPAGCRCKSFFHGPWLADRDTVVRIIRTGYEILDARENDSSPDCFLGQIVERAKIPVNTDILKSYSRNTIEGVEWIREAREAISNGAVSIHGIKTAEVLEAITR